MALILVCCGTMFATTTLTSRIVDDVGEIDVVDATQQDLTLIDVKSHELTLYDDISIDITSEVFYSNVSASTTISSSTFHKSLKMQENDVKLPDKVNLYYLYRYKYLE